MRCIRDPNEKKKIKIKQGQLPELEPETGPELETHTGRNHKPEGPEFKSTAQKLVEERKEETELMKIFGGAVLQK